MSPLDQSQFKIHHAPFLITAATDASSGTGLHNALCFTQGFESKKIICNKLTLLYFSYCTLVQATQTKVFLYYFSFS